MRRFLALAIALALTFVVTPVPGPSAARAAAGPCIGAPPAEATAYAETRQFVDTQSWWMPDADQANNAITNTGHLHLGACIPERETISSGNLTINVRVILHDNPGAANYVSMVFITPSSETAVQKCYLRASATDFTCPGPSSTGKGDFVCAGTCERWLTLAPHLDVQACRPAGDPSARVCPGAGRQRNAGQPQLANQHPERKVPVRRLTVPVPARQGVVHPRGLL